MKYKTFQMMLTERILLMMENYSKLLKQTKHRSSCQSKGGELKSKRSQPAYKKISSSDDRKDIADAILPLNKKK
jgi:hypothetical protein